MNWYVYCGSNPLNFWDPLGLDPFDHFSSRDDAAADFGMYIGQKSIDIEEEFFSFIYKGINDKGEEYFYYNEPGNDYTTHEERKNGFYFEEFDSNAVAVVHTHGAYDANNKNTKDSFSYPDNSLDCNFSDTAESDRLGIDYYVVTPAGNLYMYESNSGNYVGTLVRQDMPIDSRIEIHQKMSNTLLWGLLYAMFDTGDNNTSQKLVNAKRNNPDDLMALITELKREVG